MAEQLNIHLTVTGTVYLHNGLKSMDGERVLLIGFEILRFGAYKRPAILYTFYG